MKEKFKFFLPLKTFAEPFKKKEYLFLFCTILLGALVFFLIALNRKPFNYVSNAFLVLFVFLANFYAAKEDHIRFDFVVVFFLIYFFVALVASFITSIYSLSPFANSLLALSTYEFVCAAKKERKPFVFFIIFVAFALFQLVFIIYYLPWFFSSNKTERLGSFFGNQDGVAAVLCISVLFGLFYCSKKYWFFALHSFLGFALIAFTQTRTSLGICVFCFLICLFVFFRGKPKKYLFFIIGGLLLLAIVCLSLPSFSGVRSRINDMILTFLGLSKEESTSVRINLDLRSCYLGFSHLLYGYGYEGILRYDLSPAHDSFGDVALYFGGLFGFFAIFSTCALCVLFCSRKGFFRIFLIFLSVYFFIMLFFGQIYSSRLSFVLFPLGAAILEKEENKEEATSMGNGLSCV